MKYTRFPNPLKGGSKIAIVSPAGYLTNPAFLDHVAAMIKEQGCVSVYSKNCFERYDNHYAYAGTPQQRLADLQWACDDPDIEAIWLTRGGYGCVQLLDGLNLSGICKNPKWLIGYSDITYLHSAFNRHGIATIHGHNVVRTLSNGVAPPASAYGKIFDILKGSAPAYEMISHKLNQTGKAKGRLVGGNQTIVGALSGTRYDFDYEGAILFLEDVGENAYYRIDRQMQTLETSGALAKIKGIIIGSMRDMGGTKSDFDETAYNLIHQITEKYKIPKIFAFPAGHVPDNYPLMMGAEVEMEVQAERYIVKYALPHTCS
ncbi:LD-carboxypeptidase [Pseudomonas sp. P8_241]|uniref:S66 peptidase family protein n=1 Tax=Pseudomonas sp. P8_241 TaxID=3043445 RepID=UPI002A3701DC|nr:LD-carboxypeptidase [Pseudomonas sp. P8_241]WPN44479.1 LD-carboxypeptidase [Pseudomonas sp. P8_241]